MLTRERVWAPCVLGRLVDELLRDELLDSEAFAGLGRVGDGAERL